MNIDTALSRRDAALIYSNGGLWDLVPLVALAHVLTEVQRQADAAGRRIPKRTPRVHSASLESEILSAEDIYIMWVDLRDILAGEIGRREIGGGS